MNAVRRNKVDGVRQARYLVMAGLVLVSVLLARGHSFAQAQVSTAAVVQVLEAQQLGVTQPLGVAYMPEHDDFVLLAAPADSGAAYGTLVRYDPAANEARVLAGEAAPGLPPGAPLTMTYDPVRQRLLLLDASTGNLLAAAVAAEQDILSVSSRYETAGFHVQRAEGITVDPATGALFILDGAAAKVIEVEADGAGSFESTAALREGRVHEIDLRSLGARGLRDLAFNPATGRLYVLDPGQLTLYEVTRAGQLVTVHDLQHTGLVDPHGMTFAPSGDQTDDPGEFHLMVADRGASPGKVVELTLDAPLAQPAAAAAAVELHLVRRIDTSAWSPSSPDPSGITYHSQSGQLIVADGEVDEIKALFTARQNVYRASLAGALADTMSTIGFSPEPTGVGYNPANGHLFYSDDDARKIYEVNPGSDGVSGTGDDTVTSFSVSSFGSRDPEDVAYDLIAPGLWIIDGANAQVYHLLPGANRRFDGVAPEGDDVLSQFDTRRLGIIDPEGIYRDPATGNLILTSADPDELYEVTTSGSLLRTFDVSEAKAIKLAGVVMAPSSTAALVTNFYLVDRAVDNNDNSRENDGRIYEFTQDNTAQPTPVPSPTPAPPSPTPSPTPAPPSPTPAPPSPTPAPPPIAPATNDVLWLPWVGR